MSTASTSESALAARRRRLGAITLVLLVGDVRGRRGHLRLPVRRRRAPGAARRGGRAVLCAFEVTDFPFWQRHSTAAVIGQSIFAAVALAGLLVAIAVTWRSLAGRRSGAVAARI